MAIQSSIKKEKFHEEDRLAIFKLEQVLLDATKKDTIFSSN